MKKLVLNAYGELPRLIAAEIPKLIESNYVVRMSYAPLNPSDLNFSIGSYGIKKELPTTLGFEGSGIIEQAEDEKLIGKKVSISTPKTGTQGTYSTHMVVPIASTIVWPDDVDLRQIACSNVNPLTVIGFKNVIDEYKYNDVILSAANSQLGRMAIQYLTKKGINVSGTVRHQDQVEDLLKLGAKRIFVGDSDLQELRSFNSLLFFDAVGGDYACKVFNHLPNKSKMIVYGRLSKQSYSDVNPSEVYYNRKSIEGFWLVHHMSSLNPQQVSEMKQQVIDNHKLFEAKIKRQIDLQNFEEGFSEALKGGSEGKILLKL